MEPGLGGLLEVPVVDELGSVVLIEEGVYGVLILYGQVHAGEQVVVAVSSGGCGGFQQGQLAAHDADSSPVDVEPVVKEDKSGVTAYVCPFRGIECSFFIHMDEDVVPGVVQQHDQLAQLSEILVSQYQVCVTVVHRVCLFYFLIKVFEIACCHIGCGTVQQMFRVFLSEDPAGIGLYCIGP